MMKKRILLFVMAFGLLGTLAGCGTGTADSSPVENGSSSETAQQTSAEKEEQAEYTIGVCQLVQHEDLDAATEGFQDAVKKALGDDVEFDVQNAQNDSYNCSVIINGFVSNDVDLIMANGTPALQAAAAGTDTIPILGTCVTDYAQALNLKDFDGTVGGNISGTSDVSPLDQQADAVKELFPDEKQVGLLYCSAESNSKGQAEEMKQYLLERGYECTDYTFSDSNDLAAVVTKAAENSDLIYIPTDNTVGSNAGIVKNICLERKVPVFTGSETICKGCGAATLCLDAYELGYRTGEMAAEVLSGETDISEMPIENAPHFTKKYNPEICEALGIEVPEDYEALDE